MLVWYHLKVLPVYPPAGPHQTSQLHCQGGLWLSGTHDSACLPSRTSFFGTFCLLRKLLLLLVLLLLLLPQTFLELAQLTKSRNGSNWQMRRRDNNATSSIAVVKVSCNSQASIARLPTLKLHPVSKDERLGKLACTASRQITE